MNAKVAKQAATPTEHDALFPPGFHLAVERFCLALADVNLFLARASGNGISDPRHSLIADPGTHKRPS